MVVEYFVTSVVDLGHKLCFWRYDSKASKSYIDRDKYSHYYSLSYEYSGTKLKYPDIKIHYYTYPNVYSGFFMNPNTV